MATAPKSGKKTASGNGSASGKGNEKNSKKVEAKSSARSTVSGPAKTGGGVADAPTAKIVGTEKVARAFPFNAAKPSEFGDGPPVTGQTVAPPHPMVSASTLTETNASPKTGRGNPQMSFNPGNAPLDRVRVDSGGRVLTTNQGVPVADNQNSLKAGLRGPSLLEDFILREKITHFDHERIPERVVHARGSGAHGFFECYKPLTELTRASIFAEAGKRTPLFVRFSTVVGERGSTDTARDVRGFAVKFYTDEGNWDLVGNNIPVFFIQDAMKFPDLVHAVKPEPHHAMPQAASAHDTFWDFVSLMPETTHMLMWVMSDRAIPRSLRMMQGFGVHTFRLVNEAGRSRFVKFHWNPAAGTHSLAWDEAVKISGADSDFHRRDLWEAIESGNYPEWELGIQVVEEADEDRFDFDLLDATKIIPEELVPVQRIGRMVLNRNTDNFFAETEQAAFHVGHVVPGIDVTNDPLLQGRLFSYMDTQLTRLGGPNFQEIPINRPIAPVHNNQRDGFMRQTINAGRTAYEPNSLGNNDPAQTPAQQGGYRSYPQQVSGQKVRGRSEKFFDFFTQATLFYRSQAPWEQRHIAQALQFELGKCERPEVRSRMVGILTQIDRDLAQEVATGLGMPVPAQPEQPMNRLMPASVDPASYQPRPPKPVTQLSPALSMANTPKDSVATRKVAILAADGVDGAALQAVQEALRGAGAMPKIVAPHGGAIQAADGSAVPVDFTLLTSSSVLFDATWVADGASSVAALRQSPKTVEWLRDTFLHCKTLGATGASVELLAAAGL